MTGELSTLRLALNTQTFSPVWRLMQCTRLSCAPTTTKSSFTAHDDCTEASLATPR